MATASIINNIFEDLCRKYSGETYLSDAYYLEEATILNPYLITTLPGSNMIRCLYKRKNSTTGFVLKFEDNREKMACILNQMMDKARSSSERINCLPAEIVHHIATYLGSERSSEHSSEPNSSYIPEDFSPYYQLTYKGPLPEFISLKDMIILYKLGHVDLVKSMFYNGEDYFVMSYESFNSGLNPQVYLFIKNINDMRCVSEKILEDIKARGGRW
jgi:hypothetical protein